MASVISADGTVVGYQRFGRGPGCVLLHGALQSSQNFTKLASALADRFTVYVPDRRGRGLSGPPGNGHTIDKHCEDLAAILAETGTRNVFGLSSGAIVALRAALIVPGVDKVAAYEPPLSMIDPTWFARYTREVDNGQLPSAFVTVLKGTGSTTLPRAMLTPLATLAIAGDRSLKELIPTMRFEAHLEPEHSVADFAALPGEVLLLGGSKSAAHLRATLDELSAVIPHAQRTEFPGLGHLAADNRGKPHVVAERLAAFFGTP
jgi:pimeloyl-ACP methyl ester carboxylesterase